TGTGATPRGIARSMITTACRWYEVTPAAAGGIEQRPHYLRDVCDISAICGCDGEQQDSRGRRTAASALVAVGSRLPLGPFVAAPVATAFVLPEHILLFGARAPVVLVNDDLGIRWIRIG